MRSKKKDFDVSKFWCWNEQCRDYGKKGKGNIVPREQYGENGIWLLKCKTCDHCFSENHGTVFFHLKTPRKEVLRTLALFPEKGSIRGISRATGHDKNMVMKWINIAGQHCQKVNEYFLQDLELDQVQVDEIWSYIKKGKKSHRK